MQLLNPKQFIAGLIIVLVLYPFWIIVFGFEFAAKSSCAFLIGLLLIWYFICKKYKIFTN